MKKMNKKGFTLIEMLVVIAIIAVLVAIVVPVVSNSTAKAAAAANAANLRSYQASLAIEYATNPDNVTVAQDGTVTCSTVNAPEWKTVANLTGQPDAGTAATAVIENNAITASWGEGFGIDELSEVAQNGVVTE